MPHDKRKNWRSENELVADNFLALLGLSAGMVVAGGVFSFIVELGVISDFADRTHTGNHILIYEDMVAAGAILETCFRF